MNIKTMTGMALAIASAQALAEAEFGLDTIVTYQEPVRFMTNGQGRIFLDYGKTAFGWLEVDAPADNTGGTIRVAASEVAMEGDECDLWPGATIRCCQNAQQLKPGKQHWRMPMLKDNRNINTNGATPAVKLPAKYGRVMPFRYAEVFECPFAAEKKHFRRAMIHYPYDMKESSFTASNQHLVDIYELCKYSMLATSFTGLFIDGDRERIPYEADAYINQLGAYSVFSDTQLPRATFEYLMRHPTWPTEWKQHMIMIAWADWMWTGNTDLITKYYDRLVSEKLMGERAREDGLLKSEKPKRSSIDLIDWPPRDRCGYVFTEASAVINAFYYLNLNQMAAMAKAIGRNDEAAKHLETAKRVLKAYNDRFYDEKAELYVDGIGTTHHGFHANAAALAFGLVPTDRRSKIADWLYAKGMPCSVYFAQYYLEALYAAGKDKEAMALITADTDRSWVGMLKQGATITFEAWNMPDKPNFDLNHAWGAPALNIITRFVLGITPLEPGFAKALIEPRPANVTKIEGKVPSVKGPITVKIDGAKLSVSTPVTTKVIWHGQTHEVTAGQYEF